MISTAEAFSGTWALNARGWTWVIVPTVLVAAAQEAATGFPDAGWVFTSAVLQVVAVIAWSILVAGLSRVWFGRVVPVASGLLWAGGGLAHALVGAACALAAGLPAEWGYRIAFWVIASLAWMPLLTYALAQWDLHRRLLAERARLEDALAAAEERAAEDAGMRTRRLSAAIDNALAPALDEIGAQLRENAAGIDDATATDISAQLDALARQTAEFAAIEPAVVEDRSTRSITVADASVEFELRRPVFAALLTAVASGSVLLPEAYRSGGWFHIVEMALSLLVATLLVVGAFAILRPLPLSGSLRSLLSRIGLGAAGIGGGVAFLLLDLHGESEPGWALALLVPLLVIIGASAVATAVALSTANTELHAETTADRQALDELTRRIREVDEISSARLATLLRGQLNGRLAACAMALAFLGSGSLPASSRDQVVATVLSQLEAAAAELRLP